MLYKAQSMSKLHSIPTQKKPDSVDKKINKYIFSYSLLLQSSE